MKDTDHLFTNWDCTCKRWLGRVGLFGTGSPLGLLRAYPSRKIKKFGVFFASLTSFVFIFVTYLKSVRYPLLCRGPLKKDLKCQVRVQETPLAIARAGLTSRQTALIAVANEREGKLSDTSRSKLFLVTTQFQISKYLGSSLDMVPRYRLISVLSFGSDGQRTETMTIQLLPSDSVAFSI